MRHIESSSVPNEATPGGSESVRVFWSRVVRGPSPAARMALYEQLAALVQAGIGVRQALTDLSLRERGGSRRAAEVLLGAVTAGEPMGPAMARRPELFAPVEASLVHTGEVGGRLVEALRSLAARMERERAVRQKLLGAVAYPGFLAHLFILMPTVPLIAMRQGFGAWLAVVVPALAALWAFVPLVVSVHVALRDRPGYARFVSHLPIVGPALRAGAVARFAWAFAALYEAGAPADQCLEHGAAAAANGWIAADVARAVPQVQAGNSVTDALAHASALPADLLRVLATGEQSGTLGESAVRAVTLFDDRLDRRMRTVTALLPGVLLILVAIPIAVLYYQVLVGPILRYL